MRSKRALLAFAVLLLLLWSLFRESQWVGQDRVKELRLPQDEHGNIELLHNVSRSTIEKLRSWRNDKWVQNCCNKLVR